MKTTVRTEAEAVQASVRRLLKPGWRDGLITDALEKLSRAGNDCIELTVIVEDRTFRDWLSNADIAAAKTRHCVEAVGALERYEATGEIGQDDFPGHAVQVKIGVKKGTRNFPGDRNVIEDYRAAGNSRVVSLRTA